MFEVKKGETIKKTQHFSTYVDARRGAEMHVEDGDRWLGYATSRRVPRQIINIVMPLLRYWN